MATFPGLAVNPESGATKKLNIFIDQGSKYTCIEESAARALGLKFLKSSSISVARFKSSKPKKVKVKEVEFFHAYAVQGLAPALPARSVAFDADTRAEIEKFKPVNMPPKDGASSTQFDVLLGMDYWHSIMGAHISKQVVIQGSLVIHFTPFGNILAGNALEAPLVPIGEVITNLLSLQHDDEIRRSREEARKLEQKAVQDPMEDGKFYPNEYGEKLMLQRQNQSRRDKEKWAHRLDAIKEQKSTQASEQPAPIFMAVQVKESGSTTVKFKMKNPTSERGSVVHSMQHEDARGVMHGSIGDKNPRRIKEPPDKRFQPPLLLDSSRWQVPRRKNWRSRKKMSSNFYARN